MKHVIVILLFAAACAHAQQEGATNFIPTVGETAFAEVSGPVILIDEAHHNYHTAEGRYGTFAEFLRKHHCTVLPSTQPVSLPVLSAADIFVIANAQGERNVDEKHWCHPIDSAFTAEEIDDLAAWVRDGGSLFLIVDHMPFPGAIDNLAQRFGISFSNGFAWYEGRSARGMMFTRMHDAVRSHWITDTPLDGRRVDSVVTFTGSAFRIEGEHHPLLVFGARIFSVEPDTAWVFHDNTPRINVEGWRQGAALEFGRGRIVVFGEAALFTAQVSGANRMPMGLNAPGGENAAPLLVNIIRWLARQ